MKGPIFVPNKHKAATIGGLANKQSQLPYKDVEQDDARPQTTAAVEAWLRPSGRSPSASLSPSSAGGAHHA